MSGGCSLSGDPPGRATSICAAVRDVPRGTPYHLFTRCRVSRPRRLFRARLVPAKGRENIAGFRRSAAYVDGARRYFTPLRPVPRLRRVAERLETTSRRATWAEACESEGPVRAHSSREWSVTGAPPRGRPRAPSVITPGACVAGVAAYVLAMRTRSDRDPRSRRPPRRRRRSRRPGCLEPFRRSGAGEESPLRAGRPASMRRRPSRGVADWRASAGSTSSSRLTLNAWSGD